jgi:hypothetical protein
MATAKSTTNHNVIQRWVEARGGHPARVKRTGRGKDPGILRIDYPGFSGGDTLERIDWDQFFDWFDRDKLAFLYEDTKRSKFSKFVKRGTAKRAASGEQRAGTTRKRTASGGQRAATTTKKRPAARKTASRKPQAAGRASGRAAKKTKNHNTIRKWVEARGGWPATVKGTKTGGEEAGLLRIDYPGYSGEGTLERIDWEDFFRKFDEENLTFLYQDTPRSRFSKFVRS